MKDILIRFLKTLGLSIERYEAEKYEERRRFFQYKDIYTRYSEYTMIPLLIYIDNLGLSAFVKNIEGDIVECGVWRGGMIAGISEILGKQRKYWLFDSFEGLPQAQEVDGTTALKWQADTKGPNYFNNCAAEEKFAIAAMKISGTDSYELVRGWFSETVPHARVKKIALLRLDGDWYESTITCLEGLYEKVSDGGLIIIDDYYFWDGCARAVHDFLSKNGLSDRICQSRNGVAYIIKNKHVIGTP